MGSGPTLRVFNAINGKEVIEALLFELRRQLEADTRFTQHNTFPLITWEWVCQIKQYPNEPSTMDLRVGPNNIGDPAAAEVLPEVTVEVTGSRDISIGGQTADSVRRDIGIAVPTPRTVKVPGGNRIVVDAPDIKPTDQPRATVTPAEQTNVNKGGRVFARSVTAKTAANPEGVEVNAPSGSGPDRCKLEEISEIEKQ